MYDIRNYTNTKCELEMAKTRLNLLMDRKEKLYCKYFPVTSKIKEISTNCGNANNDKMAEYLSELTKINSITGKSLDDEIKEQTNTVKTLQGYLNKMNNSLSKMTGIEYKLFYEIVVNGISITKAIEKVSFDNNIEPQTIWKNYYKKIKPNLEQIKKAL